MIETREKSIIQAVAGKAGCPQVADHLLGDRMEPQATVRERMLALFKEAANGSLSLKRLHEEWPRGEGGQRLLATLFDDLLDAVEHLPGKWGGGIDWRAWVDDDARRVVLVDIDALGTGETGDGILARRRELLQKEGIKRKG